MNPVRWGVLAPGNIAHRFAQDIASVADATIVAVASRDEERSAAFASQYAIPAFYEGYDALVSDSNVDMVYVASPHALHHEHAILAMAHGKGVLVEKPLAMNAVQVNDLVSEARRRGVLLVDGLWTLFNPLLRQIASRIEQGAIGDVIGFSSNVGPLGMPIERGLGIRMEDRNLGASFLLECLVYPVGVMLKLAPHFADFTLLSAAAVFTADHVDESAGLMLSARRGGLATISGGMAYESSGAAISRVLITGTSGWIEIEDDVFDPRRAVLCSIKGNEVLETIEPSRGFAWEIEDACQAFRRGDVESSAIPHALSLQIATLLDHARASAGITVGAA